MPPRCGLETLFLTGFACTAENAGDDLDAAQTGTSQLYSVIYLSMSHLSSFAGIGYVTHVGSAFVSMTPMVGMLLSAHSCSRT